MGTADQSPHWCFGPILRELVPWLAVNSRTTIFFMQQRMQHHVTGGQKSLLLCMVANEVRLSSGLEGR